MSGSELIDFPLWKSDCHQQPSGSLRSGSNFRYWCNARSIAASNWSGVNGFSKCIRKRAARRLLLLVAMRGYRDNRNERP
jgi:hypothetical protein